MGEPARGQVSQLRDTSTGELALALTYAVWESCPEGMRGDELALPLT